MNGTVNNMKKENKSKNVKIKNTKIKEKNKTTSKVSKIEEVEKIDNKKTKKNKIIFYGIIFGLIAVLCFLFPYTHDDWAWGSEYGIERLETYFENYNGRWFGNFSVLLLTRSNILKTIVMSFCLTMLLFFVNELTENKKLNKYMSLLLLSALPYLVLRQAVVWTSGFANYVISILLIMTYIFCNRKLFDDKYEEPSKLKTILYLVLGFSTALFVEHVTLYLLALGVVVIVYKYIRFKKISFSSVMYLLGGILGTALMFSNSAYSSVASGADGYRTFELSNFIGNSIKSFFNTIYKELIFQNYVLNIALSICVLIFLYRCVQKNDKHKKIINLFTLILVAFPIYTLIIKVSGISLFLKYTKYINGLLSVVYFVTILGSSFFISDLPKKRRVIFALLSILVLTAPLFVVTPIGSRCFFPMYVLWIWVVLEFFGLVLDNNENEFLKNILITGSLTFFGYLLLVYGYIFKVNMQRVNYIEENRDKEILVLPKLPYGNYHWLGNPINDEFMRRFKSFYDINQDVEIEFVSLKEWKKVK